MSRPTFGELDFSGKDEWRFEEQVVKDLLRHFGLGSLKHELLESMEDATGARRLTLPQFFERLPSFPIWLSVRMRSRLDKDCTTRRLLTMFDKTPLMKMFEEAEELRPDGWSGRPMGVVTRFPRCSSPAVFWSSSGRQLAGARFVFGEGRDEKCLQLLPEMLAAFEWDPAADV